MTFDTTPIPGAFLIGITPAGDERGWFGRTFCADEFRAHGLAFAIAQSSLSHTTHRGTVRGMHYQEAPAGESKLVRCVAGAACEVLVDLRPDSPAYLRWWSVELSAGNRQSVYVPEGCALGFQALEDDCELLYDISHPYTPERAAGFRYDDPLVGIDWPLPVRMVSARDLAWAPLVRKGPAS